MTSMVSKIELYPHQLLAVKKLHSGAILAGKVGSGKTLAALQFYKEKYESTLSLIVITTAKKRNDGDWEKEAQLLGTKKPIVDSGIILKSIWINVLSLFLMSSMHQVLENGGSHLSQLPKLTNG